MAKLILAASLTMLLSNVQAQPTLADQINSVHAVELQQQEAQRAAVAAHNAEAVRATEKRNADLSRAQLAREAAARRAEETRAVEVAARKADMDAKAAEGIADKKRDQSYEDQLRALQLEEKKMKLEAMRARTNRTNDYIDQELRQQAAHTDVVQSQADTARNLAEGNKSLLQNTGEAQLKEASRWFK